MCPFFLTLFVSCGHALYISLQSVEHMRTCEGNIKGDRGWGGEWDFALVWNPIKKFHL
jgi:hypothetical protein